MHLNILFRLFFFICLLFHLARKIFLFSHYSWMPNKQEGQIFEPTGGEGLEKLSGIGYATPALIILFGFWITNYPKFPRNQQEVPSIYLAHMSTFFPVNIMIYCTKIWLFSEKLKILKLERFLTFWPDKVLVTQSVTLRCQINVPPPLFIRFSPICAH